MAIRRSMVERYKKKRSFPMNNGWNENRFVKRKGSSEKEVDGWLLLLGMRKEDGKILTFWTCREENPFFGIEMDGYKYHK